MEIPQSARGAAPHAALDAATDAAVGVLTRRGYLTTEWWTTAAAAALSSALALVGVPGPVAVQVCAVLAPVAVAVAYALARSSSKSSVLGDLIHRVADPNPTPAVTTT